MSREFKSIPRLKYTAKVAIEETITHSLAQNGYGDIKREATPNDTQRSVLDVFLSSDSLEKLQAKIVAHVGLAE